MGLEHRDLLGNRPILTVLRLPGGIDTMRGRCLAVPFQSGNCHTTRIDCTPQPGPWGSRRRPCRECENGSTAPGGEAPYRQRQPDALTEIFGVRGQGASGVHVEVAIGDPKKHVCALKLEFFAAFSVVCRNNLCLQRVFTSKTCTFLRHFHCRILLCIK